MADAIIPENLPAGMDAYLGYVDGRWPDYLAIAQAHGDVPVYGLTVLEDGQAGDGTDTEPGDGDIAGAVAATKAELARRVDRPVKYCPLSWAQNLVDAHTQAGIPRGVYRLLTAHYGGPTWQGAQPGQHICGPACGYGLTGWADGTQWIDHGDWDESLLSADFIIAATHPGPPAPPPPSAKEDPVILLNTIQESNRVFAVYDSGKVSDELDAPTVAALRAAGVAQQAATLAGIAALAADFKGADAYP